MTGVSSIPDDELLRRAVRHAVRQRRTSREFAWAAVSRTFALGSTYATQLCWRFGINPDDGSDVRPRPPEGPGEPPAP